MKKMKPLEDARKENEIDKFRAKMESLGFTFQPIEKPETYTFKTSRDVSWANLSDLSVKDREVIESILREKGADGALVIDLDCKGATRDNSGSLYVTLLIYNLSPIEE